MREENEKKKPSACGALGLDRTMDLGTQSSLRSPPFLSSFAFEFESVSRFFFVLLWLRILYRFGAVRDRFLYLRIPLAFGGIRDIFPTWISCFYWIFFLRIHITLVFPIRFEVGIDWFVNLHTWWIFYYYRLFDDQIFGSFLLFILTLSSVLRSRSYLLENKCLKKGFVKSIQIKFLAPFFFSFLHSMKKFCIKIAFLLTGKEMFKKRVSCLKKKLGCLTMKRSHTSSLRSENENGTTPHCCASVK